MRRLSTIAVTPWKVRVRHFLVSVPWVTLQLAALLLDLIIMTMHIGRLQLLCMEATTVVYSVDLILRAYAFGKWFGSKPWNIADTVVVVLCGFLISLLLLLMDETLPESTSNLVRLVNVLRFSRLVRMLVMSRSYSTRCLACMRRITGENKRRFLSAEHDFDLDLTYITSTVIAMSVPAARCWTALYRNPISEVVRFFELFHQGQYLIINTCPEIPYPVEKFVTGHVSHFYVQDHMPPTFNDLVSFLGIAQSWFSSHQDPNMEAPVRVIAIHCRGGKGRTGSFICCWLLYTKHVRSAAHALQRFEYKRTDKQVSSAKTQGVDTPSQRRYVGYMAQWFDEQACEPPTIPQAPPARKVQLLYMTLETFFCATQAPMKLLAVVQDVASGKCLYVSTPVECDPFHHAHLNMDLSAVEVAGDVRVSVFKHDPEKNREVSIGDFHRKPRQVAGKEKGCLFYIVFHTHFLSGSALILPSSQVDMVPKKLGKLYRRDGTLSISFVAAAEEEEVA